MRWDQEQNKNDIIVSTRVRLARNLEKYPFPNAMSEQQAAAAAEEIKNAILKSPSTLAKEFQYMEMTKLSGKEKRKLAELHLISPDLINSRYGALLLGKDENMSIMINEEDHIRLQVILGGSRLHEAWDLANKIDDVLEESLDYAFDEKLGYLTACPTNLGTGLRASLMLHLPALTMTDSISGIISSAGKLGIAVRGSYGEGSKALGNLYQISNSVTMGSTEEELIKKLSDIAGQIEDYEKEARKKLEKQHKDALEDRLWRSYGTLRYARKISSNEAKSLISDVILGKAMNIIKEDINVSLISLMVQTEPAQIAGDKEMTPEERDRRRAELIRNSLSE